LNLRRLWKLSNRIYREISFQSLFSLRTGSSIPQSGRGNINQIIQSAQINALLSKILTTILIGFLGFTILLPLTSSISPGSLPREVALVGGASTFLSAVMFLVAFMGLQVATSLVSSKISETLSPLPLTKRDISNITFICFTRIFDIPLVAAVIVLLGAYFLAGGTILGGLIAFVSIIVTEVFALTLAVGLARFFYAKVTSGGGRSKWKAVQRAFFMLVWILPTFGSYFVMNCASQIFESSSMLAQNLSSTNQLVMLVYPFCFSTLISFATLPQEISLFSLGLASIASLGYAALAVICFRWVTNAIRQIGNGGIGAVSREPVKDTLIKPQRTWLGIIHKDLRIASRAPSYASLFLLPALQTALLAISFSSFDGSNLTTALGALTGMSMVTLLLPPTLFSIEGLASAYTRSLPTTKRMLIFAKTFLSVIIYLSSLVALSTVTLCLGRDFTNVLVYGLIHMLSITAAILLELKILVNKFWKEGFAMGNIYARLSTFILILIPAYVIAGVPLAVSFTMFFVAPKLAATALLVTEIIEFAVMVLIAFHKKK
jgi:hypothetical protein